MEKGNRIFKNIVFDFGGVLLDLDPESTWKALSELLEIEDISKCIKDNQQLLDNFEIGKIRYENFLWNLQRLGKKVPDPRKTINAWNAMLKGWNKEKLILLEKLKVEYNLFLLSNTNEMHLQWVMSDLRINHGIADFKTRFFKKVIFSHEVGFKKPDPTIFQYLLSEANILPEESLFIDDLPANVEAASKLGFQSILHQRNASLDYLSNS